MPWTDVVAVVVIAAAVAGIPGVIVVVGEVRDSVEVVSCFIVLGTVCGIVFNVVGVVLTSFLRVVM